MCIAGLIWQPNSAVPLTVLSNRDEFVARSALPLHVWPNGTLAGQDLQAGGTWLGMLPGACKLALVTNVREQPAYNNPLSRGAIISDYLHSGLSAASFAATYDLTGYAGVNVLLYDGSNLLLCSNRAVAVQHLPAGVYVVSNGVLLADWPKTRALAKAIHSQVMLPLQQLGNQLALANTLSQAEAHNVHQPLVAAAMLALADKQLVSDLQSLPNTGVGEPLEQLLSAICIAMPGYGTLASTLVVHSQLGWYASEYSTQSQHTVQHWVVN